MKVVFFAKGERGLSCLQRFLKEGYRCEALILHPESEDSVWQRLNREAGQSKIPVLSFSDPNTADNVATVKSLSPDLFILAGYGKILKKEILQIPSRMAINFHGGKLPQYRGSSPLNWCLINGDSTCTVSVIQVESGIDTGAVLAEASKPISPEDTIRDLHDFANKAFPDLMINVLQKISDGTLKPVQQNSSSAAYYPRRFADDGLILWDRHTAVECFNRIRALTDPYPGAFTYLKGKKIFLKKASLTDIPFYGKPGRIYRVTDGRFLIAAKDKALWIDDACAESGESISGTIQRYDDCLTVENALLETMKGSAL